MSEKTEKATPHKLKQAQEKGQVSKSNELSIYTAFLIFLSTLYFLWPHILSQVTVLCKLLLRNINNHPFSSHLIQHCGMHIITIWLPVAGLFLLTFILMTLMQTGLTWAPKALVPDFKRLNPALNLKKWFTIVRLFDAIKSFSLHCQTSGLTFLN